MHRVAGAIGIGLAAAGAAGVGGCERTTRDSDIRPITTSEVWPLYQRVQKGERNAAAFVDPRPQARYDAARIPGALNLTLPKVDAKGPPDPRLTPYNTIVVYGDDPGSATAKGMVKRLILIGHPRVRWYSAGLKEWTARGYPIEGTGDQSAASKPPEGEEAKPKREWRPPGENPDR
ncbi:MAG: rhodanese-like domain-containing protein [Phycisphaerae bacterium]|nr:rhodanese-like domain-containing protein [Phycisphaerae bacterium]